MKLPAREIVRLYHWLRQSLFWQWRQDEMKSVGETGLALLGDDLESAEAVLMNYEIVMRNEQLVDRLPYSEELMEPYIGIFWHYGNNKNLEAAMRWFQIVERLAQEHHDLRALCRLYHFSGDLLMNSGDSQGAISRFQQSLEISTKIGDDKHKSWNIVDMAGIFLSLGDIQKAEEYAYKGLEITDRVGNKVYLAISYTWVGIISTYKGDLEKAVNAHQKTIQILREIHSPWEDMDSWIAWATHRLGWTYLHKGERLKALNQFKEMIELKKTDPFILAVALSGLEEAYQDAEEFHAFCRHLQENPEIGDPLFVQWYLEPSKGISFTRDPVYEDFNSPDWVWHDQFGDCSFKIGSGVEIHAANGRDLWYINLSAPRILRQVSGNFSILTVCIPVYEEKPARGGILLWKDERNFLRLEKGDSGLYDIIFHGYIGDRDVVIGRGRLTSERALLRLEKIGVNVNALCSADGKEWFSVGHVEFPVDDPVEVGLYAIGNINRSVYPGAYPDGTAIRFESFQLLGQ